MPLATEGLGGVKQHGGRNDPAPVLVQSKHRRPGYPLAGLLFSRALPLFHQAHQSYAGRRSRATPAHP
jgi:hypothetical protein